MEHRRPDQDRMPVGGPAREEPDASYRDASYLGTSPRDDEEVHDLGFIVEDHDDRRAEWLEGWQRLENLDTDEPLETNRSGRIPGARQLARRGLSEERFATDYHTEHADAQRQEEEFVRTSMLETDPEPNAGAADFTAETLGDVYAGPHEVRLSGHAAGVRPGSGTTLPQDIGGEGFSIKGNPEK